MQEVIDGLLTMFLRLEVVNADENSLAVLVFSAGCGIIGVLAVMLDGAFFLLQGKSLLKLKHGWNTLLFLAAWALGAMIIGFVGQLLRIFLVSLSACVMVGFSWPVVFTKILEKAKEGQMMEPEQPVVEEA